MAHQNIKVGDEVVSYHQPGNDKHYVVGHVTDITPTHVYMEVHTSVWDGHKDMRVLDEMKKVRAPFNAVCLHEKHLTAAEMKKREQIAKAMERENPGMDMSKKMAIATSQAKKVAEEVEQIDEISKELATDFFHKKQDQARKRFLSYGLATNKKGILLAKDKIEGRAKVPATDKMDEDVVQIDEISHETRGSWIHQTWKKHLKHVDDKPGTVKTEMPAARQKVFGKALDVHGKESMRRSDEQQRNKRLARTPQVHDLRHMSHGEVYDHTQTSDKIKDGDVLRVKGGTAAMIGAWPAMVHGKSETLHKFNSGTTIHNIEGGSYRKTAALADKVHGLSESVIELESLIVSKGIQPAELPESYKSDDAFNLLKKKGAKNVRTTSGGIVYNHNGKEYTLRHSDTNSGHRTVREAELSQHIQRLSEGRLGDILKGAAADTLSAVADEGINRLVYGKRNGQSRDLDRPNRESFPRNTLERPNSSQRPTYDTPKPQQRDYYREEYGPGKLKEKLLARVIMPEDYSDQ